MFNFENKITFGLVEKISQILKELSPDEILYWLRKGDELKALLKKGEIHFLIETGITKIIQALPKQKMMNIFRYRRPFNEHLSVHHNSILCETYSSTDQMEAFSLGLTCTLDVPQVIKCIDALYILSETVFTPQQIRSVALEQNQQGMPGLLKFDCTNYFPILNKENQIIFASLRWRPDKSKMKLPKNKWKFDFDEEKDFLFGSGNLVLLRECR